MTGADAPRRQREVLVALVLLALGVRALESLQRPVIFNDGPRFISMAQEVLAGDLSAALRDDFHPLTSLLMAALSFLTSLDLELAGRLLAVASGGLGTAAVFWLAREQFGARVGAVSGLLFAVHPRLVAIGANVQSDGINVALCALGALAVWRGLERRHPATAFGAGAICGLAYLTRPEALVLGAVLGVWLLVDLVTRGLGPKRALLLGLAFSIGVAVCALPYLGGMRELQGEWTLTRKKSVTSMLDVSRLVAPESGEVAAPQEPSGAVVERGAVDRLRAAMDEILVDGYRALHPVFLVLLLVGLRGRIRERRALYFLSFAAIMAAVLLTLHLSSGYVSRRHWMVVVALAIPLCAVGLLDLAQLLGRPLGEAGRARASVAACAVLVVGLLAELALSAPVPAKAARKQAALWIAEHRQARCVAAPRERVAYYAGAGCYLRLPKVADAQLLVDRVRDAGADFLVVEQARLGEVGPEQLRGATALHRVPYPGGAVLVLALDRAMPSVGGR